MSAGDQEHVRQALAEMRELLRLDPAGREPAPGPRFFCPPVTLTCTHRVVQWSLLAEGLPRHATADEECPACHNLFRSLLPVSASHRRVAS